jgi:hypothetical protein
MSIRSILKQWTYRKRVRDWPERAGCALEAFLNPASVQGLRLGSHFDEASKLGRPVVTVISATMVVRLDFLKQGVTLEYEDDRLDFIGIILTPDRAMPEEQGMSPATVFLTHRDRMALSPAITAEKMIELLGKPVEDDRDDPERLLSHQINGWAVDTEFTRDTKLRRINLFPVY